MAFMSLFGKKEASPEVAVRIRNSKCGQVFADNFVKIFSKGDSHLQWLMANSRKRMLTMKILKEGVQLIQIDRSQGRSREYGWDYEVGREDWSFGASGYEDLPNKEYVTAFVQYLYDRVINECPDVEVSKKDNYIYVTLADSAKKGW